mmetsp:Transcript_24596/g.57755  ORF Transcript_24596/g.57755 Transcript_24596/m.57755 type:complete len:325 (+) Transcript_24596:47-1021(+)
MKQNREELDDIRVERWCRDNIKVGSGFLFDRLLFYEELKTASQRFDFPLESLQSLFRSLYVKHIKSISHRLKNSLETKCMKEYLLGRSILDLSKESNFPPALMARRLVEEMTIPGKKKLSTIMKNPLEELGSIDVIKEKYQISESYHEDELPDSMTFKTTRLSCEVKKAIDADPLCGPASDRERHFVGIEYEIVLERELKKLGIPFESEAQLREKGSARTPDVVLSCPVSFRVNSEWHMVSWIDSKALYGDYDTHQTVLLQAKSYIHRFGPGMILYWFGHGLLSKLGNADGDLIIVGWRLPDTILWPTGEVQLGAMKNEAVDNR